MTYDTVPDVEGEESDETEYFEVQIPTGTHYVEIDSVDSEAFGISEEALRELYPVVTESEEFGSDE